MRQKLDSLGCFRNIAVFIDTSKGANATPEGLEVSSIRIKIKRRKFNFGVYNFTQVWFVVGYISCEGIQGNNRWCEHADWE